ncbi:MAG: hypothetical protein AB1489_04780 [Acidobacteriota bacterium]
MTIERLKRTWQRFYMHEDSGSALIIVTLLLALLTIYISASLTVATTDAISSNYEVAQQRGFYTAYSKMEQMSRDFSALFLTSVSPSYNRMCDVVKADPTLMNNFRVVKPPDSYSGQYTTGTIIYDLGWAGNNVRPFCFIDVCNPSASPSSGSPATLCGFPIRPPRTIQVEKGDYAGLQGFARRYRMISTVESENRGGADVQLVRDFDNILLPLFQFGLFTESEFELYNPPTWSFGGWVHTNSDFFLTGAPGSSDITFSRYTLDGSGNIQPAAAQITVAKHMVIGNEKSGGALAGSAMEVYKDSSNTVTLNAGSANTGPLINNCNKVVEGSIDSRPASGCNNTFSPPPGVIRVGVKKLQLPIQNLVGVNPIELIKRGIPNDYQPASLPLVSARYYYKPGIRITLADYQNQLPPSVPATTPPTYGGVQLDGADPWLGMNVGTDNGLTFTTDAANNPNWYYQADAANGKRWPIPRGYQPKIKDSVNGRPTGARVNGYRIHGWIKVEIVKADGRTFDITEEILNLGVTVPYTKNGSTSFYYPRLTPKFPPDAYPDENSIIHLQRFAVAHTTATIGGGMTTGADVPAELNDTSKMRPVLESVDGINGVEFDYYASMSMRDRYNDNSLRLFGIEDDPDTRTSGLPPPLTTNTYLTRYNGTTTPYAEPQPDPGGYYTDIKRAAVPWSNLSDSKIDFTGNAPASGVTLSRVGTTYLSENVNLPKSRRNATLLDRSNAIFTPRGETTWFINNRSLVPFPINMYDTREGVPHERNTGTAQRPVPGLQDRTVNKPGVMNLVEIDMGNLGRLLKGDFDRLFEAMGDTPYKLAMSTHLTAAALQDNITINQDNGWIVYISDRRGDEPRLRTNVNIKNPALEPVNPDPAFPMSIIGDGEYNREDVVWNPGGDTGNAAGKSDAVPYTPQHPCVTDNKDYGKSPQDSNNDCFIQRETWTNYSETSPYNAMFDTDQLQEELTYSDLPTTPPQLRLGNVIAITQVPTNPKPSWSVKPPVTVQPPNEQRVELFRRGVRLVNASNLFPTGPQSNTTCNNTPLGLTFASENPVYVLGNYNVPVQNQAGTVDKDAYPGLTVAVDVTDPIQPTSPARYYGQLPISNCTPNCHVPAAIVADAITLLSNPCVGTTATFSSWSGASGIGGWLDARSFTNPYQTLGHRSARNSAYRFAMVSGSTPSWYPNFWTGSGTDSRNQGPDSQYSSGGLNNFPRFLEDWRQNGTANLAVSYAGSMINIYKSRQGNGAFKRYVGQNVISDADTEYVYRPPFSRDWIFDLDFTNPCTLPPASPFLQLIDFKGFQQSTVQR